MSDETDDRDLEVATMRALRGAEDLKARLLVEMATGSPAVADLAYAIKVRVKEDYKIIEKVRAKREKRPEYRVGDLRDIVGLRIVTLYRLDALNIIPPLIRAIQSNGAASSLFRPSSLEEIIIYSTNPKGDAQDLPARVMSLFKSAGLGKLARIDETPQNYTSIHMVAWGRGKYRDNYVDVPVEIQIRTAFEDVWGEIDHALKYKRHRSSTAGGPRPNAERLQTSLAHLNVLKTMIDGIAQYADQIKLQITELDHDRLRSSVSKSAEEPLKRLGPLTDLPADLKAAITKAVAEAQPALEAGPNADASEKLNRLRNSLDDLQAAADQLSLLDGLAVKTRKETDYVISMQRALLLFEIGNTLDNGVAPLTQAANAYAALEARFPKRVVVKYRHAKVLDALGQRASAIAKLREVRTQLARKGEPLFKDHWIRAAAPRILGVLLWETADALRQSENADGRDRPSAERVQLLREAYDATRESYEQPVKEAQANGAPLPAERIKAANNLLYYALEFLETVRLRGDVPAGVNDDAVRGYLNELGGDAPEDLADWRFLDTARRALAYLGDTERAARAAERLLVMIDDPQIAKGVDGRHRDDMIAASRAAIARHASGVTKRNESTSAGK
jgi:ppGpp synthetase/RelA/SpoT-type nucleotidyltranferase